MSENEFSRILDELINDINERIGDSSDILQSISGHPKRCVKLMETIDHIKSSLEVFRIVTKYLLFDLEATRREKNKLRMTLEDR